jgi:hypothetical protein
MGAHSLSGAEILASAESAISHGLSSIPVAHDVGRSYRPMPMRGRLLVEAAAATTSLAVSAP